MAQASVNLLLQSLSSSLREQIISASVLSDLPLRTLLEDQDEHPAFAYFLTKGMASVVVELSGGQTAEVALIGSEGLTGSMALLGESTPSTRCFMQIAGSGYKMPLKTLRPLFLSSEELRHRVLQFVQQQSLTTSQLVACSQLHDVVPKLARWLLMLQDRVGDDSANVTHEFLAQMLGAKQPTVTISLAILERAGLIGSKRAQVNIINRDGLIKAACDCYPVTQRLLHALY